MRLSVLLLFSISGYAWGQAKPEQPVAPQPITPKQRVYWFVQSTIGPASIIAGVVSAGFGTAINSPHEYGQSVDGFEKRFGIRLSGISTGNAMEAGLGAIWGEDPRYFHASSRSRSGRIKNVFRMTFEAEQRNGGVAPAYARYAGIVGNNFLSNLWRADSEADTQHAIIRIGYGFLGRLGDNAMREFWPDLHRHFSRKK